MASKPARICMCGKRVPAGVRCSCQKARDQERPSARQRGYDHEWQVAAAAFLKAHPTCTCGRTAVLVRHKVSIARRPDLRMEASNWLPGCRSCNARDLGAERRDTDHRTSGVGGGDQLSALRGRTARVPNAGKSEISPSFKKAT